MTFFLFPGQGSQHPGMVRDFYNGSGVAKRALDDAASVLGPGLLETMFSGTDETLRDTRAAQVSLVAAEVAIARHLEAGGLRPTGCAGHRVGEIAALVVAASLSFADALALTQERARLMSEEAPEGSMAAVLGLAPEAIEAALPAGVEVANFNGPQQTIISGSRAALAEAGAALKAAGAQRVLPLNVSGPFHSSYMRGAAEQFRVFVQSMDVGPPAVPFLSSVSAQFEDRPETIRELLCRQLCAPVRWTEVMGRIGRVDAVEVGPGTVLAGLAKRMTGGPKVLASGTIEKAEALTVGDRSGVG